MFDLKFDAGDYLSTFDSKRLLKLTVNQKKRLNRMLGRYAVKQTRKRIRNQKDVRGGSLAKRQNGNKRVLAKLGKGLVVYARADRATITWRNNLTGSIAYKHHHGVSEVWTAAKMKRLFGEPDYTKPATREQARSLLAAGFTAKIEGRTRRPSQKWIMENLKIGHAGVLLRTLRKKKQKQTWLVPLPKRQVLGATAVDVFEMVKMIKQFIQKK